MTRLTRQSTPTGSSETSDFTAFCVLLQTVMHLYARSVGKAFMCLHRGGGYGSPRYDSVRAFWNECLRLEMKPRLSIVIPLHVHTVGHY